MSASASADTRCPWLAAQSVHWWSVIACSSCSVSAWLALEEHESWADSGGANVGSNTRRADR